jgi:hypothetical protein
MRFSPLCAVQRGRRLKAGSGTTETGCGNNQTIHLKRSAGAARWPTTPPRAKSARGGDPGCGARNRLVFPYTRPEGRSARINSCPVTNPPALTIAFLSQELINLRPSTVSSKLHRGRVRRRLGSRNILGIPSACTSGQALRHALGFQPCGIALGGSHGSPGQAG